MIHWPHLSLVTFVPLVGTASILMARGDELVVARDALHRAVVPTGIPNRFRANTSRRWGIFGTIGYFKCINQKSSVWVF